jgi:hypothetical protein
VYFMTPWLATNRTTLDLSPRNGGIFVGSTTSVRLAILLFATTSLSLAQPVAGQPDRTGAPHSISATPQANSPLSSGADLTVKVTAAALGGFVAWLLTKSLGFLILRQRLLAYLLVVLNEHFRDYHRNPAWLTAVREKTLKEGHLVKEAAIYTKDELADLTAVRQECLTLLRKSELIRVTKIIQAMWAIETLLAGYSESLAIYNSRAIVLDASDLDLFHRREDRILSYLNILPRSITRLGQLPSDYSGIHPPETLVLEGSAGAAPQPSTAAGSTKPSAAEPRNGETESVLPDGKTEGPPAG